MKLSFKNRISLFNTLAVAIIMAIVFVAIYAVVYYSSYRHLDNDISIEKEEVFSNLAWKGDEIIMNKMPEWEEAEHRQIEVNPTFIQIVDLNGETVFKSNNLQNGHFLFNPNIDKINYYNTTINEQRIRQGQFPIVNENKKIIGHLTIGVSQQESFFVLNNLMLVLCFTYLITLGLLYLIMSYVASKAIKPVRQLIGAAANISDVNINERLPLPENEDEIHQLATTINELLTRLEKSMQQQKQFTADASHEMRTPLTAIKGTLEVLMRKKRTAAEYENKIKDVMVETDRLSLLFDELLQLARLESNIVIANQQPIFLKPIVDSVVATYSNLSVSKNVTIHHSIPNTISIVADKILLISILENLLSNAIKYNKPNGNVYVTWDDANKILEIKDDGIGISNKENAFIFNRFFRADNSRSSHIPGNGLGLSIVKKLCDLQNINITSHAEEGAGSSFLLHFIV